MDDLEDVMDGAPSARPCELPCIFRGVQFRVQGYAGFLREPQGLP